jgi:predicted esterase
VLQGGEDPVVRPNLTEDWVLKMQRAGAAVDYVKVHGNHGVAERTLSLHRWQP